MNIECELVKSQFLHVCKYVYMSLTEIYVSSYGGKNYIFFMMLPIARDKLGECNFWILEMCSRLKYYVARWMTSVEVLESDSCHGQYFKLI